MITAFMVVQAVVEAMGLVKWGTDGCHGNTGFLATGSQILHFMIKYIKNAKAYKLQNRHIYSRCGPGHMTRFL